MKPFFVRRNLGNHQKVNELFSRLIQKKYTGTGRSHVNDENYMHYPPVNNWRYKEAVVLNYMENGYMEATVEQLEKFVNMQKREFLTKLPQIWYCTVKDNESRELLGKWKFGSTGYPSDFTLDSIVGRSDSDIDNPDYKSWNPRYYGKWCEQGVELTLEEFKFLVLKQYTKEDWLQGRIAIQRSQYQQDVLLNSFMKECNSTNCNVGVNENPFIYLICTGFGKWKPINSNSLGGRPIVTDIKEIYKNENMNKKVIGYKLKEQQYLKAALVITGVSSLNINNINGCAFMHNSPIYDKLVAAEVLHLWFEEVYEVDPELPIIVGKDGFEYKGKIVGSNIVYGCAELPIGWFRVSSTRYIKSFTTSNDVFISETNVKAINKYLGHHGLLK